MARPALPIRLANPQIKSMEALPPVKYQTLDRDGQEVLVGRIKVPTPGGHAFILRRFDTGAISLTTMFRAAFPTASESDEKKEMNWVKENYDLSGNNGSTREPNIIRLAGTWIDPDSALSFAESYSLGSIATLMAKASPDPNGVYRRSSKSTTNTNGTPKAPAATLAAAPKPLPTPPSPTISTANPAKRQRKELSPAPTPPPPSIVVSPPRRSTRTKSPAPSHIPMSITSVLASPEKHSLRRTPVHIEEPVVTSLVPMGSDETVVDEDAEVAEAAGPDMHQDIEEQREMIENLKAQREAEQESSDVVMQEHSKKREREEEDAALQFDFKDPEVEERAIATNRRIDLGPRTKSIAWGVAAFAAGLGAVAFLPNFF